MDSRLRSIRSRRRHASPLARAALPPVAHAHCPAVPEPVEPLSPRVVIFPLSSVSVVSRRMHHALHACMHLSAVRAYLLPVGFMCRFHDALRFTASCAFDKPPGARRPTLRPRRHRHTAARVQGPAYQGHGATAPQLAARAALADCLVMLIVNGVSHHSQMHSLVPST